jgi:DNA-binding MarR family transcriptional regulator
MEPRPSANVGWIGPDVTRQRQASKKGKYVNMTDIISNGEKPREISEPEAVALIELFFFAYRDFVSGPDKILSALDFGRAHHRVLHFVGRDPGMTVAQLLDILKITKQSLSRVLKELIGKGYIYQKEGAEDRRQRLLFLSETGGALWQKLIGSQMQTFKRASAELAGRQGNGRQPHYHEMLFHLINPDHRDDIRDWVERVSVVGEKDS